METEFKIGDWIVNSEWNEVLQIKEIKDGLFEPHRPYKATIPFYYTLKVMGEYFTRLALPHEIPNYKPKFKIYI